MGCGRSLSPFASLHSPKGVKENRLNQTTDNTGTEVTVVLVGRVVVMVIVVGSLVVMVMVVGRVVVTVVMTMKLTKMKRTLTWITTVLTSGQAACGATFRAPPPTGAPQRNRRGTVKG